jgi:hypothetical protein
MTPEPKRQEPDIPSRKPDIQPERRPEEIPQNQDVPEIETPPTMQLLGFCSRLAFLPLPRLHVFFSPTCKVASMLW